MEWLPDDDDHSWQSILRACTTSLQLACTPSVETVTSVKALLIPPVRHCKQDKESAHLNPQVGDLLQDPDGAVRQAAPLITAQRIPNHALAAGADAAVGSLQLALQSLASAAGQC